MVRWRSIFQPRAHQLGALLPLPECQYSTFVVCVCVGTVHCVGVQLAKHAKWRPKPHWGLTTVIHAHYTPTHTHPHTYTHTLTHTLSLSHTHTHTHTHMHPHTHTHSHTHTLQVLPMMREQMRNLWSQGIPMCIEIKGQATPTGETAARNEELPSILLEQWMVHVIPKRYDCS